MNKKEFLKKFIPVAMPMCVFALLLLLFNFIPHLTSIVHVDYSKRIQEIVAYIILSALWFSGAWIVNRILDSLFFDYFLKQKLEVEIPVLIKNLSRVAVFFFAVLGIISVVYSRSISGLLTATGAIGLMLGFGLKTLVSDVFDGISISIDKPFNVGDFIHFNDKGLRLEATVIETTWRTSRFKCNTGGVLVVPNSQIYKMSFTNLSTSGRTFFDLFFKFDIDAPVARIKKLLVSAAISTPGVMEDPPPEVYVKSIDKGNITYRLMFAYPPKKYSQRGMKDAVSCKVLSLLEFLGFGCSLDKEQLVIRKTRPQEDHIATISEKEFIKRVPLFSDLSETEYQYLSDNLDIIKFKPGTNVIEVDDQLSSLYIIEEGLLSVHIQSGDKLIKVAYLNTGSFFGEMSLLTGSKASATIIAENDTTLYQVGKPAMKALFEKNPELIQSISQIIAKRQAENNVRKAEIMSSEQLNAETKSIADKLVNSICNFFKL